MEKRTGPRRGKIKDLFTSRVGVVIVNSADTLVISAFLGLTVLAVYQSYYYIVTSVYIGLVECFPPSQDRQ